MEAVAIPPGAACHPWDANMDAKDFRRGRLFKEEPMFIEVPEVNMEVVEGFDSRHEAVTIQFHQGKEHRVEVAQSPTRENCQEETKQCEALE